MKGEVTRDIFDCIPEIDFNSGYRYFLGNMDNYIKALLSILKSIKSKLPILQNMYYSEEYEGLRTITHTLRKMLVNVGASGLAESTYQVERALFEEDTSYIQEQLSLYLVSLIEFSDKLEIMLKKADITNLNKNENTDKSFLKFDFTKTKESIKLSSDFIVRKII